MDFRGHGFNLEEDKNSLSQEILIEDTIKVLTYLAQMYPDDCFIMLGHR